VITIIYANRLISERGLIFTNGKIKLRHDYEVRIDTGIREVTQDEFPFMSILNYIKE